MLSHTIVLPEESEDALMIQKAAEFAAKVHEGTVRKGSKLPYIVHPMEVALVTSMMTDDPEVISAAYLHDVMEDAHVSYDTLVQEFGTRIADIVRDESEDKTMSWKERKQATIDTLPFMNRDVRVISFADKLSNLRSTTSDYINMGDKIWERFNEKDKRQHAWYYGSLAPIYKEFEEYPYYKEYCMMWNRVFGDVDSGITVPLF